MTFDEAVSEFEAASPWLGPQHAPAVVALRSMARRLDEGEAAPALLGQFGLAFRALSKERPTSDEPTDPLEVALRQAKAG